jgi:hypothetical protein
MAERMPSATVVLRDRDHDRERCGTQQRDVHGPDHQQGLGSSRLRQMHLLPGQPLPVQSVVPEGAQQSQQRACPL